MKTKSVILAFLWSTCLPAAAQESERERMNRDIKVAENVLSTLIKQQSGKREIHIPLHVTGEYKTGKALFIVPVGGIGRAILAGSDFLSRFPDYFPDFDTAEVTVREFSFDNGGMDSEFSQNINHRKAPVEKSEEEREKRKEKTEKREEETGKVKKEDRKDRIKQDKEEWRKDEAGQNNHRGFIKMRTRHIPPMNENQSFEQFFGHTPDSINDRFNEQLIASAKIFIADYGDLLSALKDNDKIVVTTKSNNHSSYFQNSNQKYVTVTGKVSDVRLYKKGSLTRDQLMSRITVTEGLLKEELKPDYELLQTIFSRLYRDDLSKTFFVNHITYEEEEDRGLTYRMTAYSGQRRGDTYYMPTLGKEEVRRTEREKLVKELYPRFEEDLIANIVEYGKTLKSLKSNEFLTFDVTYTQCTGCKIPASATYSIRMSDLSDYASGKINKSKVISRVSIKKGEPQ